LQEYTKDTAFHGDKQATMYS